MIIAGLTGSIAMGKSTIAAMLRRLGVPVHDADATVHRLIAPGGTAEEAVAAAFPEAVRCGVADRHTIGDLAFINPERLARLENILHPLVRAEEVVFLRKQCRLGARLVVLEIPLLFETGIERRLDAVITATAPPAVQRGRVLSRPGMNKTKLRAIAARQLPDSVKCRRADYVVVSGPTRSYTLLTLSEVVRSLHKIRGRYWPPTGRAWRDTPRIN